MCFSRGSTFGPTGQVDAGPADSDAVWANATALPTSVCMSYLSWGMSDKKRMFADKLFAFESFRQLMVKLLSVTGGMTMDILPLGRMNQRAVAVDVAGRIETKHLFSNRFSQRIRDIWNQCRVSQSFPYLGSHFDAPTLWEIIQFMYDPMVSTLAQRDNDAAAFRCFGLQLFAMCVKYLDENAEGLAPENQRSQLKEMMFHKSRRSANRAAFSVMQQTAIALWNASKDTSCKSLNRFPLEHTLPQL